MGILFLRRFRCFFPPLQVILRLLDPSMSPVLDPYSPEAVARLTLTNLRIRLLKAQSCPPPAETSYPGPTLTSAAPYAVSTLLARGTCLCHGHSDRCVPHNSSRDQGRGPNMVSRFSVEFKSKSIFKKIYIKYTYNHNHTKPPQVHQQPRQTHPLFQIWKSAKCARMSVNTD